MAIFGVTRKLLWSWGLPHEGGHRDASQASNSPVTDGDPPAAGKVA